MTNPAGAVDNGLVLRLSLPAAGAMASIGSELAAKLAEQLGMTRAAGTIGQAMTELSAAVGEHQQDVEFEFLKRTDGLEIIARCGEATAARRLPLDA